MKFVEDNECVALFYCLSADCLEAKKESAYVVVVLKQLFGKWLCIAVDIYHIGILIGSELFHKPSLANLTSP